MSLTSAIVTDQRTVRVVVSSASDATALVATNWTLLGTSSPPYATPVVSYVEDVNQDALTFDLQLGFELTPGASYSVTSSGVTNGGTHAFTVPALPVVAGRSFRLIDWMPDLNLREDDSGDLRKFVSVMDENLAILLNDVDQFPTIQDPDLAAEKFVDQMLTDLGNPFTESLMALSRKRLMVRTLIPIFKQIGTAQGLINAVWFFLGLPCEITIVNRQGLRLGTSLLTVDWVLGCGPDKWRIILKVGTPSGRAFTDYEDRVLDQIVQTMRYAHETIALQEALPAPTGVTAVAISAHPGITVSWSAVTGATKYAVYMTSVTGTTTRNGSRWETVSGTSLDFDMLPFQERFFIVVAINAQGEGFSSTEASCTSLPPI